MCPVLEELPSNGTGRVRRELVERIARIRGKAREQRHVVAAAEDVHRIDLQDADTGQDPANMARIDPSGRAWVGEALGTERDPASLALRQPRQRARHPSSMDRTLWLAADSARPRRHDTIQGCSSI